MYSILCEQGTLPKSPPRRRGGGRRFRRRWASPRPRPPSPRPASRPLPPLASRNPEIPGGRSGTLLSWRCAATGARAGPVPCLRGSVGHSRSFSPPQPTDPRAWTRSTRTRRPGGGETARTATAFASSPAPVDTGGSPAAWWWTRRRPAAGRRCAGPACPTQWGTWAGRRARPRNPPTRSPSTSPEATATPRPRRCAAAARRPEQRAAGRARWVTAKRQQQQQQRPLPPRRDSGLAPTAAARPPARACLPHRARRRSRTRRPRALTRPPAQRARRPLLGATPTDGWAMRRSTWGSARTRTASTRLLQQRRRGAGSGARPQRSARPHSPQGLPGAGAAVARVCGGCQAAGRAARRRGARGPPCHGRWWWRSRPGPATRPKPRVGAGLRRRRAEGSA